MSRVFAAALLGAWVALWAGAAVAEESLDARFDAFLERSFEEQLALYPEFQTRLGRRTNYDRWTDRSDAAMTAHVELQRRQLKELELQFPRARLDPERRLSHDLFVEDQNADIAAFPYRYHRFVIDQMNGLQSDMPAFLIGQHRIESVADAEAYIARLRAVPELFAQVITRLDTAASKGILPPAFAFPYVIDDARNVISGRPFDASDRDSVLYEDFRNKLATLRIGDGERERLLAAARAALLDDVKPAYERLIAAVTRLQPKATGNLGAWSLPDGEAYYAMRLRRETTTTLSPEQIHALGLAEVARIHGAMRAVMKQVGFTGSLQDFFASMRSDERFYLPEGEVGRAEYLRQANAAIDAMRARLPEYFHTLPKAPMLVKAVEPFREKSTGKAFYDMPSPDGTRPGAYYVNLYRLRDMPTYELEALAFHEGIPGHHLQIAIAGQLESLPSFRRFGSVTAYEEGWGLYSEQLAHEMGFYADPYALFGQLTMELWRAGRLVVDTGIHAKRWSREQAIAWLQENTPNPEGQIVKAIERYFVMPGQATAYTIGKLKILELREHARAALGPAFDIRDFHDVVLRGGPMSLSVLQQQIEEYIAATKAAQ